MGLKAILNKTENLKNFQNKLEFKVAEHPCIGVREVFIEESFKLRIE